MKRKTVSILLALILVLSGTVSTFALDFTQWDTRNPYPMDIINTEYFHSVSFLIDRRIVTGDADGLFHPHRSITRAEFAIMISRATNTPGQVQDAATLDLFDDLIGFAFARPYINATVRSGQFQGRGDRIFAPGDTVTYAEAITAIIRLNAGSASIAENLAPRWPDNYIMFAEMNNLMGGRVQVADWNAPAPRGEIAILLRRAIPGV